MADAFYHGVKVVEMLRNPEWGGIKETNRLTPSGFLHMAVHFHRNYDNAYWDGDFLYFGDGNPYNRFGFFPLSTCADVVGHEFGHAITAMQSKLIYQGESGCLNEAFSDMLGEMTEFYVEGRNDFKIATDCTRQRFGYLRDMTVPSKYQDYFPVANPEVCKMGTECQDPHFCSSIPNYIFYLMATSKGWDTRLAGKAWLMANLLFWQRETSFYKAGCDVAEVVKQFNIANGDTGTVVEAFKIAGIDISKCVDDLYCDEDEMDSFFRLISTTTAVTTTTATVAKSRRGESEENRNHQNTCPVCFRWIRGRCRRMRRCRTGARQSTTAATINQGVKRIDNCIRIRNLSAKQGEQLEFVISAPSSASYQNVQIFSNNGDADLYISKGSRPTLTNFHWAPFWEGSDEWVTGPFLKSENDQDFFILINAAQSFDHLDMYACYY